MTLTEFNVEEGALSPAAERGQGGFPDSGRRRLQAAVQDVSASGGW